MVIKDQKPSQIGTTILMVVVVADVGCTFWLLLGLKMNLRRRYPHLNAYEVSLLITDPNRYWIRKIEIDKLFVKVGQIHTRVVDLSDRINIIVVMCLFILCV